MGWDSDHKFLADLLVHTGKVSLLSNDYKDGEEVLDASLYTISRIIRRVTTLARDIPYYGLGDKLTDEMKESIISSSIEDDPDGQFSWSDNPHEAIKLFIRALADPPSRAIIEGVLVSFKEQQEYKEELAKSRSQREAEMD